MRKGKADPSSRKTIARASVLVLVLGLGMSLLISGGTFAKWTSAIVQMTGANIQIGDWIAVEPPVISTDSNLPEGRVGVEYRHQLEASNSEKATWSYQQVSGSLPSGMTLSRDGLISGTPTLASTHTFNATVTNIAGSDERSFTLVTHQVAPVFATSQVLLDAFDGKAYPSTTLTASGQSKRFEVTSGSLPIGMTLSSSGAISGTPVGYGLFTFTAKVSNSGGSDSREFSINLNSDFPYITTTVLPDATKNNTYAQTLAGSGPSPRYTVVNGSLPFGVSIDSSTGRISGISSVHGLSNFTISKTNSMGTDTKELSIYTRYAAPTITTSTTLPVIRKNVAYSRQIEGTGEESTFAISEGSLPAGITLDPVTGIISGVTTQIGDFNLTVTRTNESGVATRSFTGTSMLTAPTITTYETMPKAHIGIYYEMPNTGTGEEVIWSSTALPEGLSIDPDTGLISGTPTTVMNTWFNVTAANSGGRVSKSLTLSVAHAPPIIITTLIPDAEVGKDYSEIISVTGDAITRRITGSLPSGLTFNSNTGVISGTPTEAGTFTFTFVASNNGGSVSQSLTLFIKRDAPTITTTSLPSGIQTISYNQNIAGAGLDSRYSITDGTLPSGLSLGNTTGRITGAPNSNAYGVYTFTVTKSNSAGTVTQKFTIDVLYQTPTITTTGPFKVRFGVTFTVNLDGAGNGTTHTVIEGALPEGVTLRNTGVITGTPAVTGNFTFTIQKSNESGTISKEFTLNITHVAPEMITSTYNVAYIGVPFSMQINARGLDLVYSIPSGKLPDGLTLDSSTGIISGTPTVTYDAYVSVRATNSGGSATVFDTFRVYHIKPTITTTSLPKAMVGEPYSAQIDAVGKELTYRTNSRYPLPPGLSINWSTGVISGTPKSVFVADVIFEVGNSGGTASQSIPLTVVTQAPTITVEAFPNGVEGKAYSQSLTGEGSSNKFTITAGQLPPGIKISSSNGALSGTPDTRGTYTFTVTKSNVSGTVSKEFTLHISYVLPTITTTAGPLTATRVGLNYSFVVSGLGGAVKHSVSDGALPPGLIMEEYGTGARIIGTPTTPGNYTFTIHKSNLDGEVSKEFSINVFPPVTPTSFVNESSDGLLLLRSNLE